MQFEIKVRNALSLMATGDCEAATLDQEWDGVKRIVDRRLAGLAGKTVNDVCRKDLSELAGSPVEWKEGLNEIGECPADSVVGLRIVAMTWAARDLAGLIDDEPYPWAETLAAKVIDQGMVWFYG